MTAEATAAERAAVDAVLGPPETSWEGGARTAVDLRISRAPADRRTQLLPVLHRLQSAVGWISEGGLNYACERLTVPPAEAYGVATFYAMFSVEEQPANVVHVCDDLACRVQGGRELLDACRKEFSDATASVVASPCLGQCEKAPAVLVQRAGEDRDDVVLTDIAAAPHHVAQAIGDEPVSGAVAYTSVPAEPTYQGDRLLARVGEPEVATLDGYRARGGYAALARALELGPDEVIRQITDAKLLGRGGAAFPTGVKWRGGRRPAGDPEVRDLQRRRVGARYVQGPRDHGAGPLRRDRGAHDRGVRDRCGARLPVHPGRVSAWPPARLEDAIVEARAAGSLGPDALGEAEAFDIELRRGAGAYICGEETALFNSIEGKRGEPRNKPPFPVTHGVFGKPTAINNVETLINVLPILTLGVDTYASVGTADSTGTRLFCLSGHVEQPGVYEHPHGVTLGEVIDAAGGVRDGKPLKAVLLGGAAGGFVGPDRLDARLTFEDARAGGYTLGSGVVMVFDEDTDLVDLCLRIARFFRDESCGQCVPCRVGTVRQEEAIHRLVTGRTIGSREDELALLTDVAGVMRDASICGLGQTAASAVQSAIATFGLFDGEATA